MKKLEAHLKGASGLNLIALISKPAFATNSSKLITKHLPTVALEELYPFIKKSMAEYDYHDIEILEAEMAETFIYPKYILWLYGY
jgi:hypothetical protein